jgi:glycine/D-amino acid oxidase-like deaminating enzyme
MTDAKTVSYWRASCPIADRAPLTADAVTQVAVIGAGIAGLSVAYALARDGLAVQVIDTGPIGGGMTQRTSAHLSNAIDDRFVEIERRNGSEAARVCAQSHTSAIDYIAAAVARERIECGFRWVDGFLFRGENATDDLLRNELAAAHRAGLTNVTWADNVPQSAIAGPCLRFPRQAQFHPLRYVTGLAEAVERYGGRINCGTTAADVLEDPRTIAIRTTSGRTVRADSAVIATNSPINDRFAVHTKQAPYLTYVIAGLVPKGSVTQALFWDTEDPYHYVRTEPDVDEAHDLLIVGGEDHKTGQRHDGSDRLLSLERWARERFSQLKGIAYRWSGQVLEPADGVAFIGRNPGSSNNVYIATGDSGMGLTHGTIAGILISDLIADRTSKWATLYDPSRKMHKAALTFAKENLNVAAQYLEDYAGPGDRSRRRRRHQAQARKSGGISRRLRSSARVLRGLSASRLHRRLESTRTDLGLPLSRITIRLPWQSTEWAGA